MPTINWPVTKSTKAPKNYSCATITHGEILCEFWFTLLLLSLLELMRMSDSVTVTLIEEITLMINKTVETEVEKSQIAQIKYITLKSTRSLGLACRLFAIILWYRISKETLPFCSRCFCDRNSVEFREVINSFHVKTFEALSRAGRIY